MATGVHQHWIRVITPLWWYSGVMATETRTTLRLPRDLRDRLFDMAERNRRSMHAQALLYIERGLAEDESQAGPGKGDDDST